MRSTHLAYCRSELDDGEIAAVEDALRAGWLTSGPQVTAFEAAFAARARIAHAVALNSCTAALHVALAAFDVGPGDEVVMPSLTFAAGAQCAMELGARPVFADVDPQTLSVTRDTIAAVTTPRTKAIVTMPYAGRPLGIAEIAAFARERSIRVLEDAAHGCGMLDDGTWAGTHSDAAAYSFYATKNLTTAEGGMLLTRDAALAERARRLALHGMSKDAWRRYEAGGTWRYDVSEPGFKYNMPDPLAALGVAGLARLDARQTRRAELAARYGERITAIRGLRLPAPPARTADRHAWCMYAVLVDERELRISRDELIDALAARKIGTSVHYIPTHRFTAYRGLERAPLPNTEQLAASVVSLPLYPAMQDRDVDDVLDALEFIALPRVHAVG